ncbi:MAG: putative sulfate exporter family transporter [Tepidisphaeraceae bacterium]|jgi:uncharacterized integral membrane protein (TIGR00698 family)
MTTSTIAGPIPGAKAGPKSAAFSFVALLPGLLLLLAVGYAGELIEAAIRHYSAAHPKSPLPNIEYVLWAILIGLLIGNTIGGRSWFKIFAPGIGTYEFWLKLGIVLLGTRFLLRDVAKLGGTSLLLVAIELVGAFALMVVLGRLFKLGPKLTALLAVGSSVCGVSAIIAAQGAIEADEKDASYAIAAILALGAVSLFSYPLIGHSLHLSDRAYGVWAGLSVDNTAEALAAGALYSDSAGKVAALTKTARNATIGLVVLAVAVYFSVNGGKELQGSKAAFLWKRFPKFVLGFLLFSALASWAASNPSVFTKSQITSLANLSRWAFLLTFAGVGLRTNVRELFQQGPRPFIVGTLAELFIAAFTLGLVIGADRLTKGL